MESKKTNKVNNENPFIKRNKKSKITEMIMKKRKSSFGNSKHNKLKSLVNRRGTVFTQQTIKPISLTFKDSPKTINLIKYIKLLKEMSSKKSSNIENEQKNEMKKYLINKIVDLLQSHSGLYDFFEFYQINEKAIFRIARSLHFVQKEKNDYIWFENDLSSKIYFLLKGKISFKKYVATPYEREIYQMDENNIFGMDDIIYDRKRKLSCMALEECSYLYFSGDIFKLYMAENVNKIISERKQFLLKFFNEYLPISSAKIERYISNSVENIYFRKNDIIYREGEKNTSLYLLFRGEANLIINMNKSSFDILPNFQLPIKTIKDNARNIEYGQIIDSCKKEMEKTKDEINIDKLDLKSYKVLSTLSKGSIGGLEIASGITFFKYNLICNSNFCAFFRIKLELFENAHLKSLMINLLPNLISSEKKIQKLKQNIIFLDKNINPPFCRKYKDIKSIPNISSKNEKINNRNDTHNNFLNNKKLNTNIKYQNLIISLTKNESNKTYQKIMRRIDDKFDTNEGGFIKLTNYNFNLLKQKNFVKSQISNNKSLDLKINNFIKDYEKKEKNNLKQSRVKMKYSFNEDSFKHSSENNFMNMKNLALEIGQNEKRSKSGKSKIKNWNFQYQTNYTSKNEDFINFYNNNLKIRKTNRSLTKRRLHKQIDEMMEKYENMKSIKESTKNMNLKEIYDKLVSFRLLNQNNNPINLKKAFTFKHRNFIRELIIMKKPSCKNEGTETYYDNNYNDINENNPNYTFKTEVNDEKNSGLIKIVNNHYLSDLFYNNIKPFNNKQKSILFNDKKKNFFNDYYFNKFRNNNKNRMIFYNTGQFDMPLASDIDITLK